MWQPGSSNHEVIYILLHLQIMSQFYNKFNLQNKPVLNFILLYSTASPGILQIIRNKNMYCETVPSCSFTNTLYICSIIMSRLMSKTLKFNSKLLRALKNALNTQPHGRVGLIEVTA